MNRNAERVAGLLFTVVACAATGVFGYWYGFVRIPRVPPPDPVRHVGLPLIDGHGNYYGERGENGIKVEWVSGYTTKHGVAVEGYWRASSHE